MLHVAFNRARQGTPICRTDCFSFYGLANNPSVDAAVHLTLNCKPGQACGSLAQWTKAKASLEGDLAAKGPLITAINKLTETGTPATERVRTLIGVLEDFRAHLQAALETLPEGFSRLPEAFHDRTDEAQKQFRQAQLEIARLRARAGDCVGIFSVFKGWPELSSIAARLAEVLQPPPGASPRKTATIAAQLTFDIMDHALRDQDTETQRAMQAARGLTVATINGDTRAALSVALMEIAYVNDSLSGGSQRASEMLGAVVQYAASYAHADDKNPQAAVTAAAERKKALNQLVSSLTDRSQRKEHESVFSFGSAVGVGYVHGLYDKKKTTVDTHGTPDDPADDTETEGTEAASNNYVALALPLGFAWDVLPDTAGFHAQINLLDIAQYANVSTEGKVAKTTLGTAVNLGITLGPTFGSKTTPILVAATAGWAPGLDLGEDSKHAGQFSFGVVVGTYVPLIDFN